MAPTSTSNLLTRASSKSGIKIKSVSIKKGRPTTLRFSWTYTANAPDYIAVAVIGVSDHDFVVIEGELYAKGENDDHGSLSASLDASVLKSFPGKYILVFVSEDDHDKVYAKSKPFQVKKSDF